MTHLERAERRRLIVEYASTHSLEETCKRFMMNPEYIKRIARCSGVNITGTKGNSPAPGTFTVIAMLLKGTRQVDVAQELQVSKQRVSQIAAKMREAGIPIKANRPRKTK